MRLKTLFQRSSWDLAAPFRRPCPWPDGLFPHIGAHIAGGCAVYLLTSYFRIPHPVAAVAVYQAVRQGWMMEVPSIGLPLWSAIWDTATATLAAALLGLALR